MPRRNKDYSEDEWMEWRKMKMTKMGGMLLILGIILYAQELGMLPWGGSIWTLAMVIVGAVMLLKGLLM